MSYDSTADTREHIRNVQGFLSDIMGNIAGRSLLHDASKLEEPEKSMFDEFAPILRDITYGSDEYKQALSEMGPAIAHHYFHNSHHPQFYEKGINGMSLLDIIEMLADWRAAGMRHADGSMKESLTINRARFEISEQLFQVIENTVKELDW